MNLNDDDNRNDGKPDILNQESSYMNKMKERIKEIDSQITTVVTIPYYSKHFRTQVAPAPRQYYRETKHHYMSLYEHLTKLYDVDPYVYRQREEGYSPNTNHVFPYSQQCPQCDHKCSYPVDPYDPYHQNPMVISDKCNRNHLHRWVEFSETKNPFYLIRRDIHEVWSVNNHCYVPEVKREVIMQRDDANRLMFLMNQEGFDFEDFLLQSKQLYEQHQKAAQAKAQAEATAAAASTAAASRVSGLYSNSQNQYTIKVEENNSQSSAQQLAGLSNSQTNLQQQHEDYGALHSRLIAQEEENRALREELKKIQGQAGGTKGILQPKKVEINEGKSYYKRYKVTPTNPTLEDQESVKSFNNQGDHSLAHFDETSITEEGTGQPKKLVNIHGYEKVLNPPLEVDIKKKYSNYQVKPSQRDMHDLKTVVHEDPEFNPHQEKTGILNELRSNSSLDNDGIRNPHASSQLFHLTYEDQRQPQSVSRNTLSRPFDSSSSKIPSITRFAN